MDRTEAEFTPEQADALLPALSSLLDGLREDLGLATDPATADRLEPLEGHNGGGDWASRALLAGDRARDGLRALSDRGVILRDPLAGLVDFPGRVEGLPAFLCWRVGEQRVEWWHPRDQGFSARRRLGR